MSMSLKKQLEILKAKNAELEKVAEERAIALSRAEERVAKARVKKDLHIITINARSICHISTDSALAQLLKDNAEKLDFVSSVSREQNPTSDITEAEIVRVTANFKSFCREAISKAVIEKCK